MLTGKEEATPTHSKVFSQLKFKSAKGNAESASLPEYLRSSFAPINEQEKHGPRGKKVFPQFAYGNSIECPSYLRTPNSLICRESYDNPYLKQRTQVSKVESIRGSTLNNYDFYNVCDQKFANQPVSQYKTSRMVNNITNQVKLVKTPTVVIDDMNFEKAYKTLHNVFKKQRELFTDFVEKNDIQNVYGPLNMRDRPKEFRETKNYAYNEIEQAQHQLQRSSKQRTPQKSKPKKKPANLLPSIDIEKYYKQDKPFVNQFHNSIIRDQIHENIKHGSPTYNAQRKMRTYDEDETTLIDRFEKHLEFEKQVVK